MRAVPNHGPAAPDAPSYPGRQRRPYLDLLKIVVIVGVIVGHAWAGYTALGGCGRPSSGQPYDPGPPPLTRELLVSAAVTATVA